MHVDFSNWKLVRNSLASKLREEVNCHVCKHNFFSQFNNSWVLRPLLPLASSAQKLLQGRERGRCPSKKDTKTSVFCDSYLQSTLCENSFQSMHCLQKVVLQNLIFQFPFYFICFCQNKGALFCAHSSYLIVCSLFPYVHLHM